MQYVDSQIGLPDTLTERPDSHSRHPSSLFKHIDIDNLDNQMKDQWEILSKSIKKLIKKLILKKDFMRFILFMAHKNVFLKINFLIYFYFIMFFFVFSINFIINII